MFAALLFSREGEVGIGFLHAGHHCVFGLVADAFEALAITITANASGASAGRRSSHRRSIASVAGETSVHFGFHVLEIRFGLSIALRFHRTVQARFEIFDRLAAVFTENRRRKVKADAEQSEKTETGHFSS